MNLALFFSTLVVVYILFFLFWLGSFGEGKPVPNLQNPPLPPVRQPRPSRRLTHSQALDEIGLIVAAVRNQDETNVNAIRRISAILANTP